MAKEKYYDHLKPQLGPVSFSDAIDQQIEIVNQQRRQRAAMEFNLAKDRQKQLEKQQKETLGFDVADLSEIDKQTFGNKMDWVKSRINNYYYTGGNTAEFAEDINGLKTLHSTLKNHADNVNTSRSNLEGWVTGTKQWTNNELELKDSMDTFNQKAMMWEMSGIDPESIRIDANGDTYAYYTDINGNRLKGQDGKDLFGLASMSPTRGSQEFFSPTAAPYANLLPGKFSKEFASAATRLKKDESTSYDQKVQQLSKWVTATAIQNPSVQATALNVFNENYGNAAQAAIQEDAASLQEGAAPIHVREYVDETMRFLVGNLQAKSDESGAKIKPMPSFSTFTPSNYGFYGQMGPGSTSQPVGEGITNMLVPSTSAGGSSMMIKRSYVPQTADDPRYNEVSDQYKVLSVALDTQKNLFVDAEMYFELTGDELANDPELQARRANLIALGLSTDAAKISRKKRTSNIMVAPTLMKDGRNVRNPEYMSILAKLAYIKGYRIDDTVQAAAKGMDILEAFNDEQAQIAASMPQ